MPGGREVSSSSPATCASPPARTPSWASPKWESEHPPGAGAIQHLTRLMGRGRALEAVLTSSDFDADLAERYGWVNRAVPDAGLDAFVAGVAARIGGFPRDALIAAKAAVNAVSLPAPAEVRADAALFQQLVRAEETQRRTAELFKQGFQTRGATELGLGEALGRLKAAD
ncbi:enoyl-CoA hydratase/isomerase family protein [Streptomyces sp. NBC_00151]|uniref:enoyl-CoA hydratase/isomerase family protein n=1 Tax=Streptomyces sp. NBC_00151 TaxID=2975669 RepID=UPI002DDAB77F|nr:enoyl-CoA hydratase-related protein [Streptomyces sp. NBC_00151]